MANIINDYFKPSQGKIQKRTLQKSIAETSTSPLWLILSGIIRKSKGYTSKTEMFNRVGFLFIIFGLVSYIKLKINFTFGFNKMNKDQINQPC